MEVLLVVFFCLQTGSDVTFAAVNGAALKPYVKVVDQTKDQAQLQCEVRGAFPKPELHWQDRAGNILPAEKPKESERGGRYDIIVQTTVTKTDNYRCVATQKEINHQIYAETYVYIYGLILKDRTDENIPGVAKPYVTIVSHDEGRALLQCEVRGAFPKAELHWQDGAGNFLPGSNTGGRYDINLQLTVTKTDNYRCVARQEEINHQIYAETYVHFSVWTAMNVLLGILVFGGVCYSLLHFKDRREAIACKKCW
ncbi:selection and upkeep of intraepithelial T-cells protein 2-like isoform X7 [Scomber scombrus]|uniref:Selection and upkeep of intraepithelial T-cells protein 2-like isoform X7 n=1 Tax=Scomber scombrus TaxID=13677 RepID=A0AAV1QHY0_SCOSC